MEELMVVSLSLPPDYLNNLCPDSAEYDNTQSKSGETLEEGTPP